MPSNHPYGCECLDCRTEKRGRYTLFDLGIEEVSFVPKGDNPGAMLLLHKSRPPEDDVNDAPISDEVIAKLIREEGGIPVVNSEREAVMTQTMMKRGDVIAAATAKAEDIRKAEPGLSVEAARARVWADNPDLAARYTELPADPTDKGAETIQKGADALAKVSTAAADLRRRDPSLTMAKARIQVWDTHPELADEYRAAMDS